MQPQLKKFATNLLTAISLVTCLVPNVVFSQPTQAKTFQIFVTVDWEGYSLEQENIETMQDFRKAFPHIPMLQLLNPAYFLRNHPNNAAVAQTIKSTFLPIDTQGLHIHAWKSLVKYCGIEYQYQYSFADVDENCVTGDCGYTVSLENAYTQAELTQLVSCSSEVLIRNGFSNPKHFRAGGWQLGPKLMGALQANGFIWDSSRTDAQLLTSRWHEDSGLVKMVTKLHPNSTPLDQPYAVSNQLMEYPNNASLADYTSTKQIVGLYKNLLAANKSVMVLGFHQETAIDYLSRLKKAIPMIEALAKEKGITIQWVSQ